MKWMNKKGNKSMSKFTKEDAKALKEGFSPKDTSAGGTIKNIICVFIVILTMVILSVSMFFLGVKTTQEKYKESAKSETKDVPLPTGVSTTEAFEVKPNKVDISCVDTKNNKKVNAITFANVSESSSINYSVDNAEITDVIKTIVTSDLVLKDTYTSEGVQLPTVITALDKEENFYQFFYDENMVLKQFSIQYVDGKTHHYTFWDTETKKIVSTTEAPNADELETKKTTESDGE